MRLPVMRALMAAAKNTIIIGILNFTVGALLHVSPTFALSFLHDFEYTLYNAPVC